MSTGITIFILGFASYIVNAVLIRYFLNKNSPEVIDDNEKLPDGSYAWEHTAGTGVVPKWVSLIGLLGFGCIVLGVIMVIISFFT